jgi:serine/threonine-protein kinase RsbW
MGQVVLHILNLPGDGVKQTDKESTSMADEGSVINIDFRSSFELVDLVQTVFETLADQVGFDSDSAHWMSVAIRESVTNAVRHGNKMDPSKRVTVRFEIDGPEFRIYVEDQGEGFDVAALPDPLAEENLLRANGRGIFFMKSFMDDVVYNFPSDRGTQVKMVKKLPNHGSDSVS